MKIYVRGIEKEAEMFLYNTYNKECTEEFFKKNFSGNGFERISPEEKEKCSDDCKYAISRRSYEYIIGKLDELQKVIDSVSEGIEEGSYSPEVLYKLDDKMDFV